MLKSHKVTQISHRPVLEVPGEVGLSVVLGFAEVAGSDLVSKANLCKEMQNNPNNSVFCCSAKLLN